jgi:NAD(P)-dependent dehydrogenase (short-subunit alcohol dehydrogenase family)
MRTSGRVAVVTGAGRGIGAAVARRLAAEGMRVVVNDLGVAVDGSGPDVTPAQQVVDEIRAAGGVAVASTDDVADHAAAKQILDTALDAFGQLDVVVNVAGILRDRMIFNMGEDDWDAVVRVHLRGTFNTCKWAAVHWRGIGNPDGNYRLINFISRSGLYGAPGQPNYSAAKMGIVGLTFSCANALTRYGVTSNAVAPAAVTRMVQTVDPVQLGQSWHDKALDEQSPENVAPSVAYLAREASSWLNGRVIAASGYQVTLYSNPEPIREVATNGPWNVDDLGWMMERSFRPAVESGSSTIFDRSGRRAGGAGAPSGAPQSGPGR